MWGRIVCGGEAGWGGKARCEGEEAGCGGRQDLEVRWQDVGAGGRQDVGARR